VPDDSSGRFRDRPAGASQTGIDKRAKVIFLVVAGVCFCGVFAKTWWRIVVFDRHVLVEY
jgi:hypothetical protein